MPPMPPDDEEVVPGQLALGLQTESISARILGAIFGTCLIGYAAIDGGMGGHLSAWRVATLSWADWVSYVAGGGTLAAVFLFPSTGGFRRLQWLAIGVNALALVYFLGLYRTEQSLLQDDAFGGAYPQALLSTLCGLSLYFARPFRS